MHVIYAPEDPADGERQEWDFDPKRIRSDRAERMEKEFKGTWDEFVAALSTGNTKARRVLLWDLLRLKHPTLQLRDVPNFFTGEVVVEQTFAELSETRKRVDKMPLDDEERRQTNAAFEMLLAEAREREGIPDEPDVIDGEATEVDGPGKAVRPRSRTTAAATG